jgi:Na+/proline symporter
VVQGIFFFFIFIITAYLFTSWAGGYSEGMSKLTQVIPDKLIFNNENTPIFFDRIFSWSFGFFLFPHAFQRLMMGRSAKATRQAAWRAFVVGLPIHSLCRHDHRHYGNGYFIWSDR